MDLINGLTKWLTSPLEFFQLLFSIRFMALAMLTLCFVSVAMTFIRHYRQPKELHTKVSLQGGLSRAKLMGVLPQVFFLSMMLCLNLWLAKPIIPELNEKRVIESRAIYIAVDRSGSMGGLLPGEIPEGATVVKDSEGRVFYRRIDAAADAITYFVSHRQGDRVALSVFDTRNYPHWPLDDNLKIILTKAKLIPRDVTGGTDFSTPNGPVQGAIDHLRDNAQEKSKILIMITDGEDTIPQDRMDHFVTQMKAVGIKMYVLGVDKACAGDGENSSTADINKLVKLMGGKCFAVGDAKQMLASIEAINKLEKSSVQLEVTTNYRDVSLYFGLASVFFLIMFCGSVFLSGERP